MPTPIYTQKTPGALADPTLPAAADLIFPSAATINWLGGGEGVVGTGSRLNKLTDRVTGAQYTIIGTGTDAANVVSNNGMPYFDFTGAPVNEGYSLIGNAAAYNGLAGFTIIALVGVPSANFTAGVLQTIYEDQANITDAFMRWLRIDDVNTINFQAKRTTSSETAAQAVLFYDVRTYPIIIAEADYANNRVRLTEGLTGRTTGWVTGMQGTSGANNTLANAVRAFGFYGNTSRRYLGIDAEMWMGNRLLTDAEKGRAVAHLFAKRRRLPALT